MAKRSALKICIDCGINKARKGRSQCARCANYVARYKTNYDEVVEMLERQDFKCAICECDVDESSIHIDHCHDELHIRGLLCRSCNWGLGHFKDDLYSIEKAFKYLLKSIKKLT